MNFKLFIESEEQKNVDKMISSLPKGHQKLLDGYKFTFTAGNTLDGDNDHIGYIYKNKIVVAAPWNYSRGFTTLHEIAHLVWEYIVDKKLRKEWANLIKQTKEKHIEKFKSESQKQALRQNNEEMFAMSYAATYCTHAPIIWVNKDWINFIKNKIPDAVVEKNQ